MANIRFVKAPSDNRVRPTPGVAMGDVKYSSSNTPHNSAHASAQRCDNVTPGTRPHGDIRNAAPRNLFVTSNNNSNDESMPSPASRVTTGISKKDERDNNYTETSVKVSKSQRESLSASTMEENENEKECVRVNEAVKYAAHKFEQNVISHTGGDERNKSAQMKLEDTKRKRDDNELNVTKKKSGKEIQGVQTKTERRQKVPDLLPDMSKSGDLISQFGTQQEQEQQKQKRQEDKQSYPLQSHQVVNRQNSVSTAQQCQPHTGSRPLYRSISNADIDEPSFFRSISDVKYYGLDSEDTDTLNVPGNSKEKKVLQEATRDYTPNPQRSEMAKTARQDVTSKSGLESSLKSKAGNKAESESAFNAKKSETIKQQNVSSPEEKKSNMAHEKKTGTLETSTGSALAVVKSKISEAIKTGFKKFDSLEENDVSELKNKKVNTVAEKTGDTYHEIKSNTLSVSQNRVPQERDVIVTQNKLSQEKNERMVQSKKSPDTVGVKQEKINDNVGVTSRKMTEDKKLGVAQSNMLGEKRADETQHKIPEDKLSLAQGKVEDKLRVTQSKIVKENKSDTTQSEALQDRRALGENKSKSGNNILDGTKHKQTDERMLGMAKRSTIEENMSDILKEKDVYTSTDSKIGVFEGNRNNTLGITQVNIPVNTNLPGTRYISSTEKHAALTQDKIYEERTQGKPLEESKSDKKQEKVSEEKALLNKTQSKPLEERPLGSTHGNTSKEKKLVKTQSKILEEKTLVMLENKISEDTKIVAMQSKISEEKSSIITQDKMSGDKQVDLTQHEKSIEKQVVASQGKIAEEMKRNASPGKISEERVLNAKQPEVSKQDKVGVTPGIISEDKKFGATLDEIPEEKNVGVTQDNKSEENKVNKISKENAIVQEKLSENKKMLTRCELPQDKQYKTSGEPKCQTNKSVASGEKCHNSNDCKDNSTVPQGKMSEYKEIRETTGKKSEDKKVCAAPSKVLEVKTLVVTQSKSLNDKKLEVTQPSKLCEKKLKEEKLKESKDSNPNGERNKLAEMTKSDSIEGAKSKTGKRKGSIKLEANRNHILNETTNKILEQRKNAYKQKLLDEERNATGQKKTGTKEAKRDTVQQKTNVATEQDMTMSSTALDSMTAEERLKMRRSALSNPEKMIMSQERREKIEKDVGKNKTSVARKVTQFVSAQLGLSKDEDLN
ncbi:hypothetical protein BsWGS_10452 [Bradybaena similaris]